MALSISQATRKIMRPSAAALTPYDPAFTPVEINLSANENTYGMPQEVHEAMMAALSEVSTNRYPSVLSDELRASIASWYGLEMNQVAVGNGGDELLFNLFLAFGGTGHTLVDCPPTFSVYRSYAELVETEVRDVPRDPHSFAPNVDELIEAASDASLVIVCSPNNPTGSLIALDEVERICQACPGIVLIDEAYIEFADAGSSAAPLLERYSNLAILHTLSKAFCMAGARLGYILASADVVAALSAVRQPYSVNALTQAAASVVIAQRSAFEQTIAHIVAERSRLEDMLRKAGCELWPSQANFLLVRVLGAHRIWERLRDEYSVLVRNFSGTPALADCLRITVGTPEENDRVAEAIAQLREGNTP